MSSSLLRGSRVLWWIVPSAAGAVYHLSTVKAADNPRKKIDPKDLEIYDKPEKESGNVAPEDDAVTALEEHVGRARKFVWKHSANAKNVSDSTSGGLKNLWSSTKEFAQDIQTDTTLQMKTAAITVATLTGIVVAGKGRRPLRRVFFAGGLGTATAALCYPNKATDAAKNSYRKFTSMVQGLKPGSDERKSVMFDESVDQLRSAETLMLEEAIILSEMVYDELRKQIHVEDVHLPDFMAICKEVVQEMFLGISEDFEVQTGGYVAGKQAGGQPTGRADVTLQAIDLSKRVVQEVLDAIDEDMEVQTGGVYSGVRTIALDSTVLAKEIAAAVTKALERDSSITTGEHPYLFSDPDELAAVVSEEYTKCVSAAVRGQVSTGRCHVILNSSSLAAKTVAELRVSVDNMKSRRSVVVNSSRPVKMSDTNAVAERVAASFLSYVEHDMKAAHGKDYAFSEAQDIVRKVSGEAAKAVVGHVQGSGAGVKGRKTRVALDLAKKVGEEITEAINEDIEIQTGSGFRGPLKDKPPRKAPEPLNESEAATLEGIMYSPMYVPGFDRLADAIIEEVSEDLHGRGVVVTELDHMTREVMKDILAGVSEDIEIQTGGWTTREHKPHAVLNARDFIRRVAQEVLDAIEEDMNIQTGGKLERKRDLFFDSTRLASKIVDAVMGEVNRDMRELEASKAGGPYLFSLPQELGELAVKELQNSFDQAAVGIGRNIGRIHVDVDSLSDGLGRLLKERIEEQYIRAKAVGELRDDREVAIVDLGEIRKSVGAMVKKNLLENLLVKPRPGNEPLHIVENWNELAKGVVETVTKAVQEDIEIQTGGAKLGTKANVVIDARGLVTSVLEEIAEAIEEDIDIQTGRGFQSEEKKSREEKPVGAGEPGQSEPEDKDMYSTRSS